MINNNKTLLPLEYSPDNLLSNELGAFCNSNFFKREIVARAAYIIAGPPLALVGVGYNLVGAALQTTVGTFNTVESIIPGTKRKLSTEELKKISLVVSQLVKSILNILLMPVIGGLISPNAYRWIHIKLKISVKNDVITIRDVQVHVELNPSQQNPKPTNKKGSGNGGPSNPQPIKPHVEPPIKPKDDGKGSSGSQGAPKVPPRPNGGQTTPIKPNPNRGRPLPPIPQVKPKATTLLGQIQEGRALRSADSRKLAEKPKDDVDIVAQNLSTRRAVIEEEVGPTTIRTASQELAEYRAAAQAELATQRERERAAQEAGERLRAERQRRAQEAEPLAPSQENPAPAASPPPPPPLPPVRTPSAATPIVMRARTPLAATPPPALTSPPLGLTGSTINRFAGRANVNVTVEVEIVNESDDWNDD
jgi:hypothetical protein